LEEGAVREPVGGGRRGDYYTFIQWRKGPSGSR